MDQLARSPSPRAIMAACCGVLMVLSFPASVAPVCMPSMAAELGLSLVEQGVVLGASFWGALVTMLLAGVLADRFGVRTPMLLSALLQAAGWVAMGQAGSFTGLWTAGGVVGLGVGLADPLHTPLVCAMYPQRRAKAANLLHASFPLGLMLSAGAILLLLEKGISWRWVVTGFGVISLPYGLAFSLMALPPQTHEGTHRQRTRELVRRPSFALLCVAMVMAGAIEMGPATWLPTFVQRVSDAQAAEGGGGLVLFGATMLTGRLTASMLEGWLGVRGLLYVAAGVCAAGLGFSAMPVGGPWGPVVALAAVGFGVASCWPTLLAGASIRFARAGASMFSVLSLAGCAGCGVAPVYIGYVAEWMGLAAAMGMLAVAPALMLASMAFVFHKSRIEKG